MGDVLVDNVPPVLAQMGGDAVGARRGRSESGADRIWMRAAARVPYGRDMVDIDAQAQAAPAGQARNIRHAAFRLPGFSAGKAARSSGRFAAS